MALRVWFVVGAHGDLRHIDVAVAHGDAGQILLLDRLAGGGELRHSAGGGGLGGLSAGVGVDLGVEDQDVDVLAGGQDVVQTAVADVVGPAVAAEDPDGLLGQQSRFAPGCGAACRRRSRTSCRWPATAPRRACRSDRWRVLVSGDQLVAGLAGLGDRPCSPARPCRRPRCPHRRSPADSVSTLSASLARRWR